MNTLATGTDIVSAPVAPDLRHEALRERTELGRSRRVGCEAILYGQ